MLLERLKAALYGRHANAMQLQGLYTDINHLRGIHDAEAAAAKLHCAHIAFCPPAQLGGLSVFMFWAPCRLEVVPIAPRLMRSDLQDRNRS